jgi:DNA-binding response OmpR family regulator/HPt (histidine-containing phosphotransfer) domain-containing protein
MVLRQDDAALQVRITELAAALEDAKLTDQTKDVFLDISHELCTPLNVVIGLSDLALRNNRDPRQGEYLIKIGEAGKKLSGIINDLLDLSKIATGRMELEANQDAQVLSLRSIDTQSGLARFAGNEDRYRHWLMKFSEEASGDLTRIQHAIASCDLDKARKMAHSLKGRAGMLGLTDLHRLAAAVETAAGNEEPTEDLLVGMDREILRVCAELKSVFPPVQLTNPVDFPVVGNPSVRAERRQQPRITGKLILLIDDDPAVLETLDQCLQQNYQTRLATCGIVGLDLAQLQPQPDLILLDIDLPDIQGYDLCGTLKDNPATAAIPVIFMSSHTDIIDITRGLDIGAVDYVTKPVAIPILLARVQTHLRLRETGDLLRNQNSHLETLVSDRTRDLEARTTELQHNQYLTILALGSIAETRDNETGNHIFRTSAYVEILAKRLAAKSAYRNILSADELGKR